MTKSVWAEGYTPPGPITDPIIRSLVFASQKHWGLIDKCGQPYILHLVRVMTRVISVGPAAQVVALFHDILEDTLTTPGDLEDFGLSNEIITAIYLLTKRDGDVYEDYISRLAENTLARIVKIADLLDNLEDSGTIPESLRSRYRKALYTLKSEP